MLLIYSGRTYYKDFFEKNSLKYLGYRILKFYNDKGIKKMEYYKDEKNDDTFYMVINLKIDGVIDDWNYKILQLNKKEFIKEYKQVKPENKIY